jgi:ribosomal-protein-alanine N-acetyltransferase
MAIEMDHLIVSTRDQPMSSPASCSSFRVAETERLLLRWLVPADSAFILELVNEPSWIRYIGDRGVRTREDAQRYIETGPLSMYQRLGYGLYLVESKELREPIGICGLIKRESLDDVDIGFAFLSRFWGCGYASESAAAVMSYGRAVLRLSRIVAILSQDNQRSGKLLEKLGFGFERTVRLESDGEALKLYAIGWADKASA